MPNTPKEVEVEFPFGPNIKPAEWKTEEAYVYGVNESFFAITPQRHEALEIESKKKFKTKMIVKDGQLSVKLPYDFAKGYLWERQVALFPIVYGDNIAISVFSAPKLKKDETKEVSELPK